MKNKTKVFLGKKLLIVQIIILILIFSITFVYGTNIVWKIPLINNQNLNGTIQNKFKNLKFDCGENKYIQGFNSNGIPICNDVGNLSTIKKIDLKNNHTIFGSGKFDIFFSKILNNCGDGMYVRGFDKNKNMICSTLSGSIFLFGSKFPIDNKLNINFPKNYPNGEFFGGKITKEFNNILNDCGENKYLQGFSLNGNIICSSLSKGVCGNSNGINTINYPTNGFCDIGNKIDIDVFGKDGTFNWNCIGILGIGTECSSKSKYDGVCGKSNGKEFFSPPKSGLCDVGNPILVNSDGSFTWKCSGLNGGLESNCKAYSTGCIDIYDDWGIANGAPYSGGNQNYLFMNIEDKNGNQVCNEWRKDSVCQSTYDWIPLDGSISLKCNISNIFSWEEDDVVTCCVKKTIKTDGVCGSSHGLDFLEPPNSNLCNYGISSDISINEKSYTWICKGFNGGDDSSCSANRRIQ